MRVVRLTTLLSVVCWVWWDLKRFCQGCVEIGETWKVHCHGWEVVRLKTLISGSEIYETIVMGVSGETLPVDCQGCVWEWWAPAVPGETGGEDQEAWQGHREDVLSPLPRLNPVKSPFKLIISSYRLYRLSPGLVTREKRGGVSQAGGGDHRQGGGYCHCILDAGTPVMEPDL